MRSLEEERGLVAEKAREICEQSEFSDSGIASMVFSHVSEIEDNHLMELAKCCYGGLENISELPEVPTLIDFARTIVEENLREPAFEVFDMMTSGNFSE
jgi:hypothetical protein